MRKSLEIDADVFCQETRKAAQKQGFLRVSPDRSLQRAKHPAFFRTLTRLRVELFHAPRAALLVQRSVGNSGRRMGVQIAGLASVFPCFPFTSLCLVVVFLLSLRLESFT